MNVIINQLFWYVGDKSRLNNINFTSNQALKLKDYLSKYFNVSYRVYDFSVNKYVNNEYTIHIPKPDLKYHKSWKLNRVIENSKNYDVFINIDCDVFILEENYEKIKDYILSLKDNNIFYVSNLNDLHNLNGVNFIENTFDKTKFNCTNRYVNSLGPFYIIKINDMINSGGFNEYFSVWCGEDDEFALILEKNGLKRVTTEFSPYHLPHNRNHTFDAINSDEYQEQCFHLNNTKTIKRKNFLT